MSFSFSCILVALISFLGCFEQGCTGFGSALIIMGLLPLFMPMSSAAAVCAFTGLATGTTVLFRLRKNLSPKKIIAPLFCCFLTIPVGAFLLNNYNEFILRIILACLLLLLTVYYAFTRKHNLLLRENLITGCVIGLITGIAMGMFSIIGPFLMVYYICIFDDMLELKADLELSFFLTCIYTICMHSFVYKTVTKEVLIYSAIAILCAAFATLLGLKVYEKMDKNKISTAMYILLPLMAIMLIVNAYR